MRIMENVLRVGAVIAVVLSAQVDAQEGPAPVEVRDLLEVTATVEAIDLATRTVTVRDGADNEYVVEAGPEVRNLEQVKVGDEIVVSYYAALAAEFKKPGEGVQGVQAEAAAGRAPLGERPAGAAGRRVTATIVIDSVNAEENTVTFTGPQGVLRTVAVEDPAAQAFIKQLKHGDEVELTYTEALAISVEPAE
jgi:Cu/Ag efflux protein CusF